MEGVILSLSAAKTYNDLESAISQIPSEINESESIPKVIKILEEVLQNTELVNNAKIRRRVTRAIKMLSENKCNDYTISDTKGDNNNNNSATDKALILSIVTKLNNLQTPQDLENLLTEIPNTLSGNFTSIINSLQKISVNEVLVNNAKIRRRVKRLIEMLETSCQNQTNNNTFKETIDETPKSFEEVVALIEGAQSGYDLERALNQLVLPDNDNSTDNINIQSTLNTLKTALHDKLKKAIVSQKKGGRSFLTKKLRHRIERLLFRFGVIVEKLPVAKIESKTKEPLKDVVTQPLGKRGISEVSAPPVKENTIVATEAVTDKKTIADIIALLEPYTRGLGDKSVVLSPNVSDIIDSSISYINTYSVGSKTEYDNLHDILLQYQHYDEIHTDKPIINNSKLRRKFKRALETLIKLSNDCNIAQIKSNTDSTTTTSTTSVSDDVDMNSKQKKKQKLNNDNNIIKEQLNNVLQTKQLFIDIVNKILLLEKNGKFNDIIEIICNEVIPGVTVGGTKERRKLKRIIERIQYTKSEIISKISKNKLNIVNNVLQWTSDESAKLEDISSLVTCATTAPTKSDSAKSTAESENNSKEGISNKSKITHTFFLGQLSFKTTKEDIETHIRTKGKVECSLVSVRLLTDSTTGESRGIGFVDIDGNDSDAKKIISLHHSQLNGRRINIEKTGHKGTDNNPLDIKKSRIEDKIQASEIIDNILLDYESDGIIRVKAIPDDIMNRLYALTKSEVIEIMDDFKSLNESNRKMAKFVELITSKDGGGKAVDQSRSRGYGKFGGFGKRSSRIDPSLDHRSITSTSTKRVKLNTSEGRKSNEKDLTDIFPSARGRGGGRIGRS